MAHTARYTIEPRPRGGFYVVRDGVRETHAEDESSALRAITRLATIDRVASGGDWIGDLIADDDAHVHVTPDSRYVVVLAIGYDDDGAFSPSEAAVLALDRTRSCRRGETSWVVYDRHTGEVHGMEQQLLEESAI